MYVVSAIIKSGFKFVTEFENFEQAYKCYIARKRSPLYANVTIVQR